MRLFLFILLFAALPALALPGLAAEGETQNQEPVAALVQGEIQGQQPSLLAEDLPIQEPAPTKAYGLVLSEGFHSGDVLVWRIQPGGGDQRLLLQVQNRASVDSLFVVSLRNPALRDLTWRWSREGHADQILQTGIRFPFGQRPLSGHFFSVPMKLAPEESGVLALTLDNGGFRDRAVLRWETAASFEASRTRRLLFLSAYSAVALFTLALGFLILAFIRAYIRFSYLFFFAIGLLAVATIQGVGYAVIWPRWIAWQSVAEPVLLNATCLGGLRFLQRFLYTKSTLPRGHWLIMVLIIGFGLFSFVGLWVPGFGPNGIAIYQNANDAWFLAGIAVFLVAPIVVYTHTKQLDNLGLLAAYSVLLVAIFLGIGEGLGWWRIGRGLETGLWIGGMLLHTLITNVIVNRMRLVVLEQIKAKADLDAHKVRLLRTLVIQEEAERVRIGADLHDEAGSRFASLKMALSGWAFDAEPGEAKTKLEDLADKVDDLCEASRELSHRLLAVSLEKLGLEEALQAYRRRLLRQGRHVVFRLEAGVLDDIDETASILLHRVVQELVEGVYESVPEMRIRLDSLSASREVLLTAEPLDEALPQLDEKAPAFRSLATRVALFQENRTESLRITADGLRIWLPKRVTG